MPKMLRGVVLPDINSRDSKSRKGGSTMKKFFKFAAAHAGDFQKAGKGLEELSKGLSSFGQFFQILSEFLDSQKPQE